MNLSKANRRQPRAQHHQQQQQQQQQHDQGQFAPQGVGMYQPPGYYQPHAPGGFYDPGSGSGGMFDGQQPGPGGYGGNQGQGQQFQAPQSAPFGMFNPAGGPGGMDPNMLYAAGSQLFANQAQHVINNYAQDLSSKSRSWIHHKLKYYFAVDTAYVVKKLLLLFFPFTHKDWSVRFNPDEPVAPRDDVNSPDLYIPSMAFVTYVLVCGFLLGTRNDFSPEKLGIQASSALAWLLVEVVLILMALYLLNITSNLGFFHLLAFSSYKFVPMIGALLISYLMNSTAYYAFLAYASASLAFFLMRSLYVTIQTTSIGPSPPQNGLYLVLLVCGLQVLVMYWLTRQLTAVPAAAAVS